MLQSGIVVCLLGFGMVFVVLALLILLIYTISAVSRVLVKNQPEQAAPAPAANVSAGATDLTPEALAAVTAALAKALDKDAGQLIIRSVTRV